MCIYIYCISPIFLTKLSSPFSNILTLKPTDAGEKKDATYAAFKSFVSQLIADASKEVNREILRSNF